MMEEWKDIPEFAGYQVSNFGRLRSTGSKARILKQFKNKNWDYLYIRIGLLKNKKQTFRVHRLIAKAFIPNPNNLPEVNHKDRNGLNNHVDNLEWVTSSNNSKHSWASGNRKISYHLAKLSPEDVFEIRCLKYYGATTTTVAKEYDVHRETIRSIWSGKLWSRI